MLRQLQITDPWPIASSPRSTSGRRCSAIAAALSTHVLPSRPDGRPHYSPQLLERLETEASLRSSETPKRCERAVQNGVSEHGTVLAPCHGERGRLQPRRTYSIMRNH